MTLDTREIPLTRGLTTIVDAADYEWLSQWKWYAHNTKYPYAARAIKINGKQKSIAMHRVIMQVSEGMMVDHINGNTLDNRRLNLRICSLADNSRNQKKTARHNATSQYKGVSLISKSRWEAQIYFNSHRFYLGKFPTELEAAHAYDEAARKYHGEFARLNFPDAPMPRDEGQAQA